jgi:hypothetical protein
MKRARIRWDRDEVLRQTKALAAKGVPLNYGNVARQSQGFILAGREHFGSWENVIKELGLDYSKIRRSGFWSRALIVERIQELKKAGKPLHLTFAESNYGGLVSAASFYFGSWRVAIRAAGLDYATIRRQKVWSRREVVSEVKRVRRNGMNVSTAVEVCVKYRALHSAAIRYFGSWRAALKAAGLEKLYWQSGSRP